VIEGREGARHPGANIEFASYGLALCAERSALVRAVFEGGREFARIAVARADGGPIAPCGACRQALADFGLDLAVIYLAPEGLVERRLGDMLPDAFELEPGAAG
jgi:cytidine deaminase